MTRNKILIALFSVLVLVSCKTPKQITYFQDAARVDSIVNNVTAHQLTILPGDVLNIVVHSRDPHLASLFNLAIQGYRIGMGEDDNYNSSQSTMSYVVDSKGDIDFPELGKIHVQGMSRDQVAEYVKNRLVNENLCKDAVVTVNMGNVYINVLGEVAKPGRYSLTKDRVTVLDALGMAGDLTIQGRRDSVLVLRREGDTTRAYSINLMSLKDVASSPAYYMHQDDVVYVNPNDYRKRQTTVNGNNSLSTSFWISVASLAASVASIVINSLK